MRVKRLLLQLANGFVTVARLLVEQNIWRSACRLFLPLPCTEISKTVLENTARLLAYFPGQLFDFQKNRFESWRGGADR